MKNRILILGATGMLGNAMMRHLYKTKTDCEVYGTLRSAAGMRHFPEIPQDRFITGIDVEDQDCLLSLFSRVNPNVVINCIGRVKQHAEANDVLSTLPINAMLPHRLARLCAVGGARLIHISTDCVFNGEKGGYLETDTSDATDLYGKSKFIGELHEPHTITLRTSIIGHELGDASSSLIDWFLSQKGEINGYTNAIFSGLPTVELAEVIGSYVLPRPDLSGLYHVAATPISKFDLLSIVARVYSKDITIVPEHTFCIDRSLNGNKFSHETGYSSDNWPALIKRMYDFN